ncbi:diguanylate cyclase [Microvirga aerilata]|uniref:Diguanylate cyclase n=1 Tax=Microvirga aerilata TaxID=670292 RepID=A0A936ZHW8_9HYPH|nr:diguanylate cyclase [Microvirga aerilata]MBL0407502.1 diguanylate cyclase [Microvirga aerilata]
MIQVVRSPLIAALVLLAIAAVIPALYFSYEIADLEYNITAARQAASQAKQARGIVDKSDQSIASFTAVALELSHEERASVLQETNRHLADLQEAFRYLEPLTKQVLTQSDFAELEERIASAQHHWEEIQEQANDGMGETEKTFHFLKIFKDTLFLRDVLTRVELFATAVAEDKTEKSLQQVKVVSRSFVFTFAVAGALALLACLCLYLHAQFVKRSERELRSRGAELYERDIRFKAAVENMPHGLVVFDNEQKVVICNRTFAKMYGLRLGQSGPGTPLRSILEHRQDIGTNPTNIANFIETRLAQVAEQRAAYTLHDLSDGRVVAVHDQPMPGGGLMAIHEDVTERRKAELRIAHLAHHDALTGLPNRVRFLEELNKALMQADAGRLAVLCLDLDNFKSINDTLGHPVGDELLIAVAERLTGSLSDNDVIARLGGDEFAIVLVEGGELERSAAVSQRIIDALMPRLN